MAVERSLKRGQRRSSASKLEAELAALSKDIETKVASAFVAFQDVIELDAEHVGSRTGMLLLAMFRGQRPEVNEHLSVLRTLTPNESLLDFAEAWSLLESAPDKAFALVKKAHESGYQTLDSERLLAQLLIELRQWAQFKVWLKAQQAEGYPCIGTGTVGEHRCSVRKGRSRTGERR